MQGRAFATVIYTVLILIAVYGCIKVRTDFKVNFFINEDAYVYNFFETKEEYFDQGFTANFYINNPDLDFSSPEV